MRRLRHRLDALGFVVMSLLTPASRIFCSLRLRHAPFAMVSTVSSSVAAIDQTGIDRHWDRNDHHGQQADISNAPNRQASGARRSNNQTQEPSHYVLGQLRWTLDQRCPWGRIDSLGAADERLTCWVGTHGSLKGCNVRGCSDGVWRLDQA